ENTARSPVPLDSQRRRGIASLRGKRSREAMARMAAALLMVAVAVAAVVGGARAQLKDGFYAHSCPRAEEIVKHYVKEHIPHAPSVAATLIRTHFHDCFVRGGPFWPVPTGRRDGTVSIKQEALDQIPAPTMNFTQLLQSFQNKSLNLADLVWLSGAHTIGIAHCNSFTERLYNFTGRGGPGDADPSLDPAYAANLRRTKCPNPNDNTTIVEMDPGSFLTFDLSYYRGVLKRRGLFQSDAALITDAAAKADILSVVNAPPEVFFQVFARSMVNLGNIEVKTGSEGEIRKHCAVVNKH
ncbi:hypothetical protein EJB05_41980, partial [Eragrostis curvula]